MDPSVANLAFAAAMYACNSDRRTALLPCPQFCESKPSSKSSRYASCTLSHAIVAKALVRTVSFAVAMAARATIHVSRMQGFDFRSCSDRKHEITSACWPKGNKRRLCTNLCKRGQEYHIVWLACQGSNALAQHHCRCHPHTVSPVTVSMNDVVVWHLIKRRGETATHSQAACVGRECGLSDIATRAIHTPQKRLATTPASHAAKGIEGSDPKHHQQCDSQ